MRSVGTILVITILLGLLAAVGWFAFAGITAPGEPMPSAGYVALFEIEPGGAVNILAVRHQREEDYQ